MAAEVSRIDRPLLPPKDPLYPDSDGKPMGETGLHVEAILALHAALLDLLAGREDVYVASDMFLYYEEGNPKANKSPDVMVIFGVGGHHRRSFKTWVEGTVPTVIFEMASEDTYREDLTNKRDLYARLGVEEYYLFDPEDLYLKPRLQGFRLDGGQYVPIAPDADGGLISLR